MHLYHTVFAVRLSLLSFAVTALLPSQCYHHAAVTPLTFHNQTVKLQSVTDDRKFIFIIYWREDKFNLKQQYFFFINRTLDAKLLIYSDRVADGKEHKECNYYPPAFLPPMQVTISAFL